MRARYVRLESGAPVHGVRRKSRNRIHHESIRTIVNSVHRLRRRVLQFDAGPSRAALGRGFDADGEVVVRGDEDDRRRRGGESQRREHWTTLPPWHVSRRKMRHVRTFDEDDDTDDLDRTLSVRRVAEPTTFSDKRATTERRQSSNWRIGLITVVVIAVLYLAKPVVVPVALAILFAFLLSPIVSILER